MSGATIRLIVLVSCAHAMVHVYELAYPSVEQLIAEQFQVGPQMTGMLGTAWRLPFGFLAVVAGWLTDRYGARRMLVTYLFGCSAMAVAAAYAPNLALLFVTFFLMGTFASIYHPAGLALISHALPQQDLPKALGIHGVFGSFGIAMAPFLAAMVLSTGVRWQVYFMVLAIPGVALGGLFALRLNHRSASAHRGRLHKQSSETSGRFLLLEFSVLLAIGSISGFIYAAAMNFFPRYLDGAQLSFWSIPREGMRNYLTAGVLLLGVIGQFTAGYWARTHTLERWLAGVFFCVALCLAWMATASGTARVVASGLFATCYFMSQPVYNSLVPKFVPPARRSFGFGLSFMLAFGLGSFGAAFAGFAPDERWKYGTLAGLAALAGLLALVLCTLSRRSADR